MGFHLRAFIAVGLVLSVCLSGCGKMAALQGVHNEIVKIEKEWIDANNLTVKGQLKLMTVEHQFVSAYNGAETIDLKVAALQVAIEELSPLGGQAIDSDYQLAFAEYLDNLINWKAALEANDSELINRGEVQNPVLGAKVTTLHTSGQVAAAERALARIDGLDLTDIPEDYQAALNVWKENIKSIEKTIRAEEFEVATELLGKNVPLVEKLNVIAEKHGLTVQR